MPIKGTNMRVLRSDTNINCNSKAHHLFEIINSFLIIAYLSIPFVWIVILKSEKKHLFPAGIKDDALIMQRRRMEDSLLQFRFLYERYVPSMVYFESVDMFRRILFVGVIPLMATSSLMRSAIGVGLSLFAMIINRELFPYVDTDTNVVAYIADIVIYLTFASALMIETGLNDGVNNLLFGLILIIVNFSVLAAGISGAIFRTKLDREKLIKQKEKLVSKIENGIKFSAHDFETVFDKIIHYEKTSSQCLFFYFDTIEEITSILHHGIPIKESTKGIIFTVLHPLDLTSVEKRYFKSTDAFIVCTLPQRLLQPVKGYNLSRSAMWLLPYGVIKTLRGMYFGELSDQIPWEEGKLLLPPHCIKRAYQISNSSNKTQQEIEQDEKNKMKNKNINICGDCLKNNKILPESLAVLEKMKSIMNVDDETPPTSISFPLPFTPLAQYLNDMEEIRKHCLSKNLIPVYHYTDIESAELIYKGGLMLNKEDGLHFTTLGPSGYSIGSPQYEKNIILDFYNEDKLYEFINKSRFDICLVFGIDPLLLEMSMMSGNDHLIIIPKKFFLDLSMCHPSGHYFLHPFNILGMFRFDTHDYSPTNDSNLNSTSPFSSSSLDHHHIGHDSYINGGINLLRKSTINLTPKSHKNQDFNDFTTVKRKTTLDGLLNAQNEITMQSVKDSETLSFIQNTLKEKETNEELISFVLKELSPVMKIDWAVTYNSNKFNLILESMFKPSTHLLLFHYGSLAEIKNYVTYGIPVKRYIDNGNIIFTSHLFDALTEYEKELFGGKCEAFIICSLLKSSLIPMRYKEDGSEVDSKSILYSLPSSLLRCMRGNNYRNIVNPKPWVDGALLLPPLCFKQVFQIVDDENIVHDDESSNVEITTKTHIYDDIQSNQIPLYNKINDIIKINNMKEYLFKFEHIKSLYLKSGLVCVYYYCSFQEANNILNVGFKMRNGNIGILSSFDTSQPNGSMIGSHGQISSGGIDFTLIEPKEFNLFQKNGSYQEYLKNIIKSIFNTNDEDIIKEYSLNESMDVCICYAINPIVLENIGGNENEIADITSITSTTSIKEEKEEEEEESKNVRVLKEYFHDFGLPAQDGGFYLRPEFIVGAFSFDKNAQDQDQPIIPINNKSGGSGGGGGGDEKSSSAFSSFSSVASFAHKKELLINGRKSLKQMKRFSINADHNASFSIQADMDKDMMNKINNDKKTMMTIPKVPTAPMFKDISSSLENTPTATTAKESIESRLSIDGSFEVLGKL